MGSKINTLAILFYLRKDQIRKDGKCSIMLRATVNGKPTQLSTKLNVNPAEWDSKLEKVTGNSKEACEVNDKLDELKILLKKEFQKIELLEGSVTAEKLKKSFIGEGDDSKTIMGVFDKFLQDFKIQVEVSKNKSPATLSKYECTYRRLKDFIREKYNKSDIILNDIRLDFITDFEIYLRTVIKCSTNSVMKYMQQLRTMILIARNNGWIEKDPFASYKLKKTKSLPRFLTQEELERIAGKKFSIERLEKVRDYFLFSCYTGLAFIDLKNLKWANIQKGLDGELWIDTKRVKTGTDSIIPLMDLPLAIIEKYNENSERKPKDSVFNVPTNQKLNSYLKEIADLCEVRKRLTFHVARHTFATTITLQNGVSMETVSRMLGHEELKTTKIYAHVTNVKISDEMKRLKEKIEDKNKSPIDLEFDKLSIEQQMKLFNIKLSMLDMETTQELRETTKSLWNCLNPEIKHALMKNTNL